MGQHRRHTSARRIMAAVQQRGPEENRINTRARIQRHITELRRIDPRPHRRIPRIHLQRRIRDNLKYRRPRLQSALGKRADPLSFASNNRDIEIEDSITLKSATAKRVTVSLDQHGQPLRSRPIRRQQTANP